MTHRYRPLLGRARRLYNSGQFHGRRRKDVSDATKLRLATPWCETTLIVEEGEVTSSLPSCALASCAQRERRGERLAYVACSLTCSTQQNQNIQRSDAGQVGVSLGIGRSAKKRKEGTILLLAFVLRRYASGIRHPSFNLWAFIACNETPQLHRSELHSSLHRHDGNTARFARRSDETLGVRVSVTRIAPSLLDLGPEEGGRDAQGLAPAIDTIPSLTHPPPPLHNKGSHHNSTDSPCPTDPLSSRTCVPPSRFYSAAGKDSPFYSSGHPYPLIIPFSALFAVLFPPERFRDSPPGCLEGSGSTDLHRAPHTNIDHNNGSVYVYGTHHRCEVVALIIGALRLSFGIAANDAMGCARPTPHKTDSTPRLFPDETDYAQDYLLTRPVPEKLAGPTDKTNLPYHPPIQSNVYCSLDSHLRGHVTDGYPPPPVLQSPAQAQVVFHHQQLLNRGRNTRADKTGYPRRNPPTSIIVRQDSHVRKSGSDPEGGNMASEVRPLKPRRTSEQSVIEFRLEDYARLSGRCAKTRERRTSRVLNGSEDGSEVYGQRLDARVLNAGQRCMLEGDASSTCVDKALCTRADMARGGAAATCELVHISQALVERICVTTAFLARSVDARYRGGAAATCALPSWNAFAALRGHCLHICTRTIGRPPGFSLKCQLISCSVPEALQQPSLLDGAHQFNLVLSRNTHWGGGGGGGRCQAQYDDRAHLESAGGVDKAKILPYNPNSTKKQEGMALNVIQPSRRLLMLVWPGKSVTSLATQSCTLLNVHLPLNSIRNERSSSIPKSSSGDVVLTEYSYVFSNPQGAAVPERLACSPPTKANRVQSSAGSLPDFRMWESCRTMSLFGGFSRGTPVFPRPFIPALLHTHLNHPHRLSKPLIKNLGRKLLIGREASKGSPPVGATPQLLARHAVVFPVAPGAGPGFSQTQLLPPPGPARRPEASTWSNGRESWRSLLAECGNRATCRGQTMTGDCEATADEVFVV
ncbi:hypothetical protein PR048_017809 [Dryococelus australis]|uniref:Uncharacterized protein n=1 Tax=Dryococelus australis TaxID=614101 RepID=A0ABQ9HAL2_9NEOP|nr:hypothetical protein PR048_017809 [Dryococelus australis]